MKVNWQEVVQGIYKSGMNDRDIAIESGCHFSHINRLRRGRRISVNYDLGARLLMIRKRVEAETLRLENQGINA